jgi:hypothetical protein
VDEPTSVRRMSHQEPLNADKRDALEAHSVRSEMKDWQNRSFLPAAASVPVVTAVQTFVEKLSASGAWMHWLVGVSALAVLLIAARLSCYCGFAVKKGASYLTQYHPQFLSFQQERDTSSRESHKILGLFYCALACYLVFLLRQPIDWATLALAIVVIAFFWKWIHGWLSLEASWPKLARNAALARMPEGGRYVEVEIKALREDIRDWQTRRFTLTSLAIASVSLAVVTSAKGVLSAAPSSGLRLTDIGHDANDVASRGLRDAHDKSFPWERRVFKWNRRHANLWRLKGLLRLLYGVLAAIALVSGLFGSSDWLFLGCLVWGPAAVFVACLIAGIRGKPRLTEGGVVEA